MIVALLCHDNSYGYWERCNNLLFSWILNAVSALIAQIIVYIEVASDVRNELKERFSHSNLVIVA